MCVCVCVCVCVYKFRARDLLTYLGTGRKLKEGRNEWIAIAIAIVIREWSTSYK